MTIELGALIKYWPSWETMTEGRGESRRSIYSTHAPADGKSIHVWAPVLKKLRRMTRDSAGYPSAALATEAPISSQVSFETPAESLVRRTGLGVRFLFDTIPHLDRCRNGQETCGTAVHLGTRTRSPRPGRQHETDLTFPAIPTSRPPRDNDGRRWPL